MCLGLVSFCRPPPRGVGGGGDGVGGGEEGDDLRMWLSGAFSPPGFCFEKLGLGPFLPSRARQVVAVGMNVGSAVASWLKGLRLLYDDECEGPTGDSSLVTLSQSATAYFANGVRVALLLRALSHDGELSLDTIKELHTPVARLYNWNVLIPILQSMGVDVDADMKVLIVAGDLDIVADVLEQLHGSGTGSGAAKRQGGQGMQQPRAAKETTSVAQFLAFCCTEQLGCSWDQAIELARSPGHKALAKQQGLGVRGEHEPAVRWFKLVFAHCKHLGGLCAGDASEAELALSAVRGGLGSFSPDVVLWCSRLLCRLAADLAHRGTQADTLWAFFSRPNGGAAMLLDAWRSLTLTLTLT